MPDQTAKFEALETPALILDEARMMRNIARLADHVGGNEHVVAHSLQRVGGHSEANTQTNTGSHLPTDTAIDKHRLSWRPGKERNETDRGRQRKTGTDGDRPSKT